MLYKENISTACENRIEPLEKKKKKVVYHKVEHTFKI